MCLPSEAAVSTGRPRGPRWTVLYGVTLPQLAALAAVEAGSPAPPVRTLLRWTLALGTFVAMALWLRANRAAFDTQEWCACAGRTMTVRVIESRGSEERVIERERERVLRVRRGRGAVVAEREGAPVGLVVAVLEPPDQPAPDRVLRGRGDLP